MSPDSLCRWQVHVSVYCARRIPAHLWCTQCSIDICFLPYVLFMADIANPDLFVCGCGTWIYLDIPRFYEEQRQPSSGSACPNCSKNGKSGQQYWGREVSIQFSRQFVTAVKCPSLVGCVAVSLYTISIAIPKSVGYL